MSGLFAVCPAKVNLDLYVLGARSDGYHELDTIFQAIDLADRLSIAPSASLELTCDDPTIPADAGNLVYRAADRLRRWAGRPAAGAALHLVKRIPAGGGLGGGSSDAAGALRLCARHWNLAPTEAELRDLAAELGADVPFFLTGGTARGTGRGDRIEALPFAGPWPILLGIPPFGVSTREVFEAFRVRLTVAGQDVTVRRFSAFKWPQGNDFGFAVNALEGVVFERWPELARFRDALLEAGAKAALLSGSGSTVYGLFGEGAALDDIRGKVGERFESFRLVPTRAVPAGACVHGGRGD